MIVDQKTAGLIIAKYKDLGITLEHAGVAYMAIPFPTKDFPSVELDTEYGVLEANSRNEGGRCYRADKLSQANDLATEIHANWCEAIYC